MARLLFVSCSNFIGDNFTGGKKASQKNYQMNVALFGKENIDVIIFDKEMDEHVDGHFYFVKSSPSKVSTFFNCLKGYTRGYTKHCEDAIITAITRKHYDYLYIDFSGYGVSLKRIRKIFNGKIITFFHDVEYMYEMNRAKHENKLYLLSALAIKKAEENVVKYSDYIIALNSRDHELIKKIYGREPDINLPVSFKDIADESRLVNERENEYLLFVGADFGPNVDGLRWFIANIMPYVSRQLKVVGKGMERYKAEMSRYNVEVIGIVEDLSDYYYKAAAVVLPIRYGDGMKVKTAEALMYGRTIIGTDEAFEGYDIKDGVEGYCCNKIEEFIEAINNLKQTGYNPMSRKLFLDKYNIDNAIRTYRSLLFGGKNHDE